MIAQASMGNINQGLSKPTVILRVQATTPLFLRVAAFMVGAAHDGRSNHWRRAILSRTGWWSCVKIGMHGIGSASERYARVFCSKVRFDPQQASWPLGNAMC